MSKNPLVSLIVPCYNMADKIHRFFDSILSQSYKVIELILVDDGSTDNIDEVIAEYAPKLKKQGIVFKVVHKKNGGLGSAVNAGLKHVTGEYLCWPDPDDYLTQDSIEKRLKFLLDHSDYAIVRSDAAIFLETDLKKRIDTIATATNSKYIETDMVGSCLSEFHFPYCPGCHMVRMSVFREVNPMLDIFEGPRGQNIQMLLPVIYRSKFGYIDECLYNYIIYKNSMSRGDDTYEKCLKRSEGLYEIKIQTLKRMLIDKSEYEHWKSFTDQYFYRKRCVDALKFNRMSDFEYYRSKLTDKEIIKAVDKMKFNKDHFIRTAFFNGMKNISRFMEAILRKARSLGKITWG